MIWFKARLIFFPLKSGLITVYTNSVFTSGHKLTTKTNQNVLVHPPVLPVFSHSPVSHELFIAAEIRNYVKEAAHKSVVRNS